MSKKTDINLLKYEVANLKDDHNELRGELEAIKEYLDIGVFYNPKMVAIKREKDEG